VKLSSLQTTLSRLEERTNSIERRIREHRVRQLNALPGILGLNSIDDLIEELAPLASPGLIARIGVKKGTATGDTPRASLEGRARPTRYSKKVRGRVRAAFAEGVKTLGDVSREECVPKATLLKWRREWGLVGKRPRGEPTAVNGANPEVAPG